MNERIKEIERLRDELKHSDEIRQSALQLLFSAEQEIDKLQSIQDKLIASFRVNSMSNPHYTHEAFDDLISNIKESE
jgi:hypothetical protein